MNKGNTLTLSQKNSHINQGPDTSSAEESPHTIECPSPIVPLSPSFFAPPPSLLPRQQHSISSTILAFRTTFNQNAENNTGNGTYIIADRGLMDSASTQIPQVLNSSSSDSRSASSPSCYALCVACSPVMPFSESSLNNTAQITSPSALAVSQHRAKEDNQVVMIVLPYHNPSST